MQRHRATIIFLLAFACGALVSCRSAMPTHVVTANDYHIYDVAHNKLVEPADVIAAMATHDVLIFGEEHNDAVAHYLEHLLLEQLQNAYGAQVALSMEMFERDVQLVVDEYTHGRIRDKDLVKEGRAWSNYKDYRPLVDFAKAHGLDVVAANAPGRYTSIAGRNGLRALDSLTPLAKTYLAPLPIDTATGAYYAKLNDTSMHPTAPGMPRFSMVYGQSVWDATMAHSIATYHAAHPAMKVFQVNGRFHSDERFGIVQQLKKYAPDCRVMVISSGADSAFITANYDSLRKNGDYIIVTDPSLPRSFGE